MAKSYSKNNNNQLSADAKPDSVARIAELSRTNPVGPGPSPPGSDVQRSQPVNVIAPGKGSANDNNSAASSRKSSVSTASWFSWTAASTTADDKDSTAWYGKLFSRSSVSDKRTDTTQTTAGSELTQSVSACASVSDPANGEPAETDLANTTSPAHNVPTKSTTPAHNVPTKPPASSFTDKLRATMTSSRPPKHTSKPSDLKPDNSADAVSARTADKPAPKGRHQSSSSSSPSSSPPPSPSLSPSPSPSGSGKQVAKKPKIIAAADTKVPPSDTQSHAGKGSMPQDSPKTETANSGSSKSWAFWSRSSNVTSSTGQVAVADTATESHPESGPPPPVPSSTVEDPDTDTLGPSSLEPSKIESPTSDRKKQPAGAKKFNRPNVVTPSLDESFAFDSQPSLLRSGLQKLSQFIMAPSTLAAGHTPGHVFRTSPARIKKVVVVGVHGYFPARLVRRVLGEPTGTSVKFANEAARAVERWADEKGFSVEIDKIALEGEGRVLKRVDKLYRLLSNWMELIENADFVFFSAHSQGTPVAVHLLARLVEEGRVEGKKLALLGMAGVCLGPMSGLDQTLVMRAYSSIESDSLKELFEFQKTDSVQSRKFVESLRTVIASDTKIVFVGSVDDQLVPLYSSTCVHVSHPNVYRAAYIDGEDVAPEFLSTLLSLVFRLRNIGSLDHGVVREISGALAGALTGAGHSKIYNEPAVYDLALRFSLETTAGFARVPVKVDDPLFTVPKPVNHNPYLLPWAVRGLLEEARARPDQFGPQLDLLFSEFDQWRPLTKTLKDLKYRLSAIQAKL